MPSANKCTALQCRLDRAIQNTARTTLTDVGLVDLLSVTTSWPDEICWLKPLKSDCQRLAAVFQNKSPILSLGCGTGFYEHMTSVFSGNSVKFIGLENQGSLSQKGDPHIERCFTGTLAYTEAVQKSTSLLFMFGHEDSVLTQFLRDHPRINHVVVARGLSDNATDPKLLQNYDHWKMEDCFEGLALHLIAYKKVER